MKKNPQKNDPLSAVPRDGRTQKKGSRKKREDNWPIFEIKESPRRNKRQEGITTPTNALKKYGNPRKKEGTKLRKKKRHHGVFSVVRRLCRIETGEKNFHKAEKKGGEKSKGVPEVEKGAGCLDWRQKEKKIKPLSNENAQTTVGLRGGF